MKFFVFALLFAVAFAAGPGGFPQFTLQQFDPQKVLSHLQNAASHWSLIEAAISGLSTAQQPATRAYSSYSYSYSNLDVNQALNWLQQFQTDFANLQQTYPQFF